MGYPKTKDLHDARPLDTLAELAGRGSFLVRGVDAADTTESADKGTDHALDLKAALDELATVATTGSYDDLTDLPTLGDAAAATIGTDVADQTNTAVECIWNGSAWTTLSGGSVPTSSALIRHYSSVTDPAADEPTAYNAHDTWTGVLA